MGKRGACKVCMRPDAAQIAAEVAAGANLRALARRLELSQETLRRHAKGCLGKTIKQALAEETLAETHQRRKEMAQQTDKLADRAAIVEELRAMHDRLDADFREVPPQLRLEASQEKRQILKLIDQLIKDQERTRGEASIFETRQWSDVETTIIEALGPHEKARHDVAAALASLRKRIELGA